MTACTFWPFKVVQVHRYLHNSKAHLLVISCDLCSISSRKKLKTTPFSVWAPPKCRGVCRLPVVCLSELRVYYEKRSHIIKVTKITLWLTTISLTGYQFIAKEVGQTKLTFWPNKPIVNEFSSSRGLNRLTQYPSASVITDCCYWTGTY